MAAFDPTTFNAFLKTYFANKVIQNSINAKKAPIWADMNKASDGGGRKCEFTQALKDVWTASADFDVARDRAQDSTVSPGLAFALPWTELNVPIQVNALAEHLSKTDRVAYMSALAEAAATAMRVAHAAMSIRATATGWGEISTQPISYTSGTSFTIGKGAAAKIVEGMPLVFSDSIHSDTLRSATAAIVTDADPDTGIITTDATLSGLGVQDGDFVFIAGDRENSATPTRKCSPGLRAWLPETRPVTDATISTLEGTARITRSYGQFVDGTDLDDLDAISKLVTKQVVQGNATDLKVYTSHARYNAMVTALTGDKRFVNTTDGNAGFLRLKVNASELVVPIVAERTVEDDVAYSLERGSFDAIGAGGEIPHVISGRDGGWFTVTDANAKELRLYAAYAFRMLNPAACGVVPLAPLS
jgi:hypothetical protein